MVNKKLIGMVHLLPLPGTVGFKGDLKSIYERAKHDARILEESDFDGLIVENYGDKPYSRGKVSRQQLAIIAAVFKEVASIIDMEIGINVQFNDYRAELAIAKACNADFVRIEVFTETVVTPSGIMEGDAAEVARLEKQLEPNSTNVDLWVDVKSKGVTLIKDESIKQVVERTDSNGADTIIVTGSGTGKSTPLDYVREAKEVTEKPVVVGSGLTSDNIKKSMKIADGGIIGSALKEHGQACNPVARNRVNELLNALKR